MKNCTCFLYISGLFTFLLFTQTAYSWGFWAHKRINSIAVYTLPPEMLGFYKRHQEYIAEHAVDPDKRRYAVKAEGPRHFIDIDHYGNHPFDSIPPFWCKAIDKYSEDSLLQHGINPWYIETMLFRLTKAFKNRDPKLIVHLSADIGHYIADAHVPLHTTSNYNGQFTNQIGIHALWESRLPELYGEGYDYFVGRAGYCEKPMDCIWAFVKSSNAAVDSVLLFERQLSASWDSDKKYRLEQVGNTVKALYSPEYANSYNNALDNMVERRMRQSILDVGSFWYTAWVNAGQPDLDKMESVLNVSTPNEEDKPDDKSSPTKNTEKGHTD
jgi:hypothetical protein